MGSLSHFHPPHPFLMSSCRAFVARTGEGWGNCVLALTSALVMAVLSRRTLIVRPLHNNKSHCGPFVAHAINDDGMGR